MTASEADERWGLPEGTVKLAIHRGKFKEQMDRGWVRKSKKNWILNEQAMIEVYGKPVPGQP